MFIFIYNQMLTYLNLPVSIVSNYLFTFKNKSYLTYTNLFLLQTHKVECQIIYFFYMLTYLAPVYILIKISFLRCRCICSSCNIYCLRLTNLFAMQNHFFALQTKLFGDIDSFICQIIFYYLSYTKKCFWCFFHSTLSFMHHV